MRVPGYKVRRRKQSGSILFWLGTGRCASFPSPAACSGREFTSPSHAPRPSVRLWVLEEVVTVCGGGGGWHEAMVLVCYWPLATAHPDPLWVRTCFVCVNGAPG